MHWSLTFREAQPLGANPLAASVLRGVSRPKLYMMSLSRCPVTTITRDDLAGFPDLKHLSVSNTPLHTLDPAILDVWPKLAQVHITDTALARDDARLAELGARWSSVVRR